jgi:glycogen debranching enzyme
MATQKRARASDGLRDKAVKVLHLNDLGSTTRPSPRLYPHQWLWDSCFIAIGLRHLDTERAQKELLALLRGQWSNGMLPHEIFNSGAAYHAGPDKWQSSKMPHAPRDVQTTGMTQPPMVAEAARKIGEKLPTSDRKKFYAELLPGLIKYHQWLYAERDPHHSGLVTLIHPWECGIEDTPYWSYMMYPAAPLRVRALRKVRREGILDAYRPDLKHAPVDERPTTSDFYTLYDLFYRCRAKKYDLSIIEKARKIPLVQDVFFNAILIRANHCLMEMAQEIKMDIPQQLRDAMQKAPAAFETLYKDGQYWSRDYRTGKLIPESSVAGLMGLYAGTISAERAEELAGLAMGDTFWQKYGIASVPTDSAYFQQRRFWQGPVWVNINWLLAEGLERYGHAEHARKIRSSTLSMVGAYENIYEYYSPADGKPAGTKSFSWSAALTLDMLSRQ